MSRQPPTFVIKFETLPRVNGIRALRALLKTALRRFGLRAIDAREDLAASAATPSECRRTSDQACTRAVKDPAMDMSQYASPTFTKFDDVNDGGPIQGKITKIEPGKYNRPVITITGGHKLSLNATNLAVLRRAYGDNSEIWLGQTVEFFAGTTAFEGQQQDSVLVRPLTVLTDAQKAEAMKRKPSPQEDDDEPL